MFVVLELAWQDWDPPTGDLCQTSILPPLQGKVDGESVIDLSFQVEDFTPGVGFVESIAFLVPEDTTSISASFGSGDDQTPFEIPVPAR